MQESNEKFKELIFDLMNGALNTEKFEIKESQYVENEFVEGSYCLNAYAEVYEANNRLCERLGVDEDPDVELIIRKMTEIGQYLSMKMYDYGIFFNSLESK